MTLRTVVLALGWFGAVNAGMSLLSWLAAGAAANRPAGRSARRLMLIRLLPACGSLVFAGAVFLPSHLLFEPRDANEHLGAVWYVLAAAGLLLLLRSAMRAAAVWRAGRRLLSAGSHSGKSAAGLHEVEGIPGVSLAGVFRPRILIGPRLARELTTAELELAVAHERAHGEALDNLTRWWILCGPDFLAGSARARRLEAEWHEAAESLADARAVGGDRIRAVHLASALIKVARLSATVPVAHAIPAWSTLNDSPLLERRVRDLLSGPVPTAGPSGPTMAAGLAAAVGLITFTAASSVSLHQLTELLVALLP